MVIIPSPLGNIIFNCDSAITKFKHIRCDDMDNVCKC